MCLKYFFSVFFPALVGTVSRVQVRKSKQDVNTRIVKLVLDVDEVSQLNGQQRNYKRVVMIVKVKNARGVNCKQLRRMLRSKRRRSVVVFHDKQLAEKLVFSHNDNIFVSISSKKKRNMIKSKSKICLKYQ